MSCLTRDWNPTGLGTETTEVSVVRVNDDDGSTVNMTLDTYQHSEIMGMINFVYGKHFNNKSHF